MTGTGKSGRAETLGDDDGEPPRDRRRRRRPEPISLSTRRCTRVRGDDANEELSSAGRDPNERRRDIRLLYIYIIRVSRLAGIFIGVHKLLKGDEKTRASVSAPRKRRRFLSLREILSNAMMTRRALRCYSRFPANVTCAAGKSFYKKNKTNITY